MVMVTSVQLRGPLTSPACGRGRRVAPGEGSLLSRVLDRGETLSPTLPRKRGRERPVSAACAGLFA
jgi:hypothetical protein